MLETGLIGEKQHQALAEFKNYVPFYRVGKDKFTKEVSLLALTAKSGIAIVSTSWNEAKSKFMDSECVDFEIK